MNSSKSVSAALRKERRQTLLFLLPSLGGMLLFFVLPFFVVIFYSFVDNPINCEFVFFDNYVNTLRNSAFQLALRNTALFSAIVVPLAAVIPLCLSIVLDAGVPFRSQYRTIFLSPLMVPVASVVLIWQVLFHLNGALNDLLQALGAAPIDWLKSDYSPIVVVVLFLWKNIGYNMILFMAALSNIPKDLLETATMEGAGPFAKFFRIKLPFLSSSIVFVAILSLINSFKVFREVYLLTGDYPYDSLYLLQHFMNNTFQSLDYQKLSSAAIVICLIMALIIGALLFADDRIGGSVEE